MSGCCFLLYPPLESNLWRKLGVQSCRRKEVLVNDMKSESLYGCLRALKDSGQLNSTDHDTYSGNNTVGLSFQAAHAILEG